MPELPEVETVIRQLRPVIKGKKILDFKILDPKLKFANIKNQKILEVFRVGKEIVLELEDGCFLVVHLRMTGRLLLLKGREVKDLADFYYKTAINKKHVRFKLFFKNCELHFVDPRRFGTAKLESNIESKAVDPVGKGFTLELFLELFGDSKQPLKNWLMRQDKIAGIGNIYASEILFAASLSPERKVNTLNKLQKVILYKEIKRILNKAIKHCGTTFSDFQTTTGELGTYQKFLKVYGREDQYCHKCNAKIIRIVQMQRSTFFCAKCQK